MNKKGLMCRHFERVEGKVREGRGVGWGGDKREMGWQGRGFGLEGEGGRRGRKGAGTECLARCSN
jgi:hypothetical protein